MTVSFRKVLFFSDGARGERNALQRTAAVALRNEAEVTAMAVVDEVSTNDPLLQHSIDRIQNTLLKERTDLLDQLVDSIDPLEGRSVITQRSVVPGKDYVEVVKAAHENDYQLIVKAVNPRDSVQEAIFGTTDLRLIHYASVPVLILKASRKKNLRRFLVAVDPHATAGDERSFNDTLLDTAASMAQQEGAELHLLHVQEQRFDTSRGDDLKALEASYKLEAEAKIRQLTSGYSNVHEHVMKGRPASVISKFVKDHDVDLLVMGNVARSGVPGLLVGNTAEKILDEVDCSVLVIKPEGWESPIG